MEAKMNNFFDSVTAFFSAVIRSLGAIATLLPDASKNLQRRLMDRQERKNESLMRLSWDLVHSKHTEDVRRGIAMLETSLTRGGTKDQHLREKLYLLTVGYYRTENYSRSRQLTEQYLEIAPEWRQAQNLKKTVEDHIAKDGVIGIGITATAVGILASLAAAAARRN